MKLDIWQVDAFSNKLFQGNPAAVVLASGPLDAEQMQAIAAENNLAETAFVRPTNEEGHFDLRWFTPTVEVSLCGHATLAAAHILWTEGKTAASCLRFETASGELTVEQAGTGYCLNLPVAEMRNCAPSEDLTAALGIEPDMVFGGNFIMAVYPDAATVRELKPDVSALGKLAMPGQQGADEHCVIVTAPGDGSGADGPDFISRMFGPSVGIEEDPVTGSAHCQLTPYWAARLGKTYLTAHQASARGGDLTCQLLGDRVLLIGDAVTYLAGTINVPAA